MFQSTILIGIGNLKTALTSDIEMQCLKFALLVFRHSFIQYFLTMLFFPSFWNRNVYPVSIVD